MIFEFDEAKSADNKAKHGLDFIEAQKLWQDVDALEVPARSDQEKRKLWIARHGQKLWSAIFTEREGRIRIILNAAVESEAENGNHRWTQINTDFFPRTRLPKG